MGKMGNSQQQRRKRGDGKGEKMGVTPIYIGGGGTEGEKLQHLLFRQV